MYGFIEIDRLANLPTRIRSRSCLSIDAPSTCRKKPFSFLSIIQWLCRSSVPGSVHCHYVRIRRTGDCGLIDITVVRCFRPSQRTGILPSANRPSRGFCDSLPSPNSVRQHRSPTDNHALCLFTQRFSLPFTSGCRFSKVFAPPPSVTSARALSSCSVSILFRLFPERYPDIFHWSRSTVAFARSHMCHQRSGRGILHSAVETLPVARPAAFAISRILGDLFREYRRPARRYRF